MSTNTVLGSLALKESSTRLTTSANLFLRDNPQTAKLFLYLKQGAIHCTKDFSNPLTRQAFDDLEFATQVKWRTDDHFWVITFEYTAPCEGDFRVAVPRYMQLFKLAMESKPKPEMEKLFKEAEELELKIQKIKESLRGDIDGMGIREG